MVSHREDSWKTFEGVWLDETLYSGDMYMQKFYGKRFGRGREQMKTKSKLLWCSVGHEENMIISLEEKWSSGNSIKCLTGSRNMWEADIKQTKTEVFWRNGQSVILLNDFEKQGEETNEVSKLIIGKNSLSISLSQSRKNELFYIMNIYLLFSQTHTHWPI